MTTVRSRTKRVSLPFQVLDWAVYKGEVVDVLANGTRRPWSRGAGADLPVRLGRVSAAVREVADQGKEMRGPNVAVPGTRRVMLGEFPSQDLIMVYRRIGLKRTRLGVFVNPKSNDPDAPAKAREVVAAMQAAIRASQPKVSALAN